jgi:outer membrane protein insertion porin family
VGLAVATLASFAVLAGCAPSRSRSPISPRPEASAGDRARACAGAADDAAQAESIPPLVVDPLPDGATIASIRTEGSAHVPAEWILPSLGVHAGESLDASRIDDGIARLFSLGAFEDVRVEVEEKDSGRVALVVRIVERPLVRHVFLADGLDAPSAAEWVAPQTGDIYEPSAMTRAAADLASTWGAMGFLDATATIAARRVSADRVDLCVHASKGNAWTVSRVDFPGASVVPDSELRDALITHDGVANVPGRPFRADLLAESNVFLAARLYDHGLLASRVLRPRVARQPRDHTVHVDVPVEEGKVYRLRRVDARGRLAGPPAAYIEALGATPGETFSRSKLMAGLERVRKKHHALGGGDDAIEPETELDADAGTVDLTLSVGKTP